MKNDKDQIVPAYFVDFFQALPQIYAEIFQNCHP